MTGNRTKWPRVVTRGIYHDQEWHDQGCYRDIGARQTIILMSRGDDDWSSNFIPKSTRKMRSAYLASRILVTVLIRWFLATTTMTKVFPTMVVMIRSMEGMVNRLIPIVGLCGNDSSVSISWVGSMAGKTWLERWWWWWSLCGNNLNT